MTQNTNTMSVLSLKDAMMALDIALDSDTPIHLIGPPGIGKSAIVNQVAKGRKMPLATLILSQCDPSDVGGAPVVKNGELDRLPLGAVRQACEEACILFLDELSCAPPAIQGAALQLVLDRRAGDRKLHPGTRIVAASNPANQSAGGWEVTLPMLSRMTQIFMRPTVDEVRDYFFQFGSEDSVLRTLSIDFAATLAASPQLLSIDPPAGSVAQGSPWPAPRSWERALVFLAKCMERGVEEYKQVGNDKLSNPIFAAGLAGNVGDDVASAFLGLRKIRQDLPTMDEIINHPDKAAVPKKDNVDASIAVLGLLGIIAQKHLCEAWVYAGRLENPEIQISLINVIRGDLSINNYEKNPWFKKAEKAQWKLTEMIMDNQQ